ncbi:uncharacterized protein M437DRAFT_57051 [Aureobasidium melanogenum CBS 110374]|uniref:Mid2 domain-containing protein n=1 Tax=Aureobasidium melanogenum (strain CBS 110374) TaxID=1043003 RepID=A0A074WAD0_AURM1|nr:uncharacterized protein M437DRAFT_57051 [Aureobasidium melanogenum CBS 110374]KEQ59476.1 hypothetical protein M437DRAFT_57051 [Aureobasidium melanogenum CBS 110374]
MYNCTSTTGVLLNNDVAFCCVDTGPNCCNNQTEVFVANDWDFKASAAEAATTRGTATSLTVAKTLTTSSSSSSSGSSSSLSTTGLSSSDFSTPLSPAASKSTYGISSVITTTEGNKNVPTNSIATPVPASTNAAPADSSTSKRDWTGIGIGASVGAAVPLLALIVVGIFLWRRHRRRRSMFESPSTSGYSGDSASTGTTKESLIRSGKPEHLKAYEAGGVQTYELDSVRDRAELPLKSPRELPGSEGERQRYQAVQLRGHSNPYQPA